MVSECEREIDVGGEACKRGEGWVEREQGRVNSNRRGVERDLTASPQYRLSSGRGHTEEKKVRSAVSRGAPAN